MTKKDSKRQKGDPPEEPESEEIKVNGLSPGSVLYLSLVVKLFYYVVCFALNSPTFDKNHDQNIFEENYNPNKYWLVNRLSFLVNWDGLYFLNTATDEYSNLKQFAFFPGWPTLVKVIHAVGRKYIPFYTSLLDEYKLDAFMVILLGTGINLFLHLFNTRLIMTLAHLKGMTRLSIIRIGLLFAVSGPSLYHVVFYSESLYLSLVLFGLCLVEQVYRANATFSQVSWVRHVITITLMGFAGAVRSVGFLNAAYIGYPLLLELFYTIRNKKLQNRFLNAFEAVMRSIAVVFAFVFPIVILFMYTRKLFCHPPAKDDPGYRQPGFCETPYGNYYSFIQEAYWNVKFMGLWRSGNKEVYLLLLNTIPVISYYYINFFKKNRVVDILRLNYSVVGTDSLNLNDPRLRAFPDFIMMLIFTKTFYLEAHPNSVERFLSAYPQYYFMMDQYQTYLTPQHVEGDKDQGEKPQPLVGKRAVLFCLRNLVFVNVVWRLIATPLLFVTNIHPI